MLKIWTSSIVHPPTALTTSVGHQPHQPPEFCCLHALIMLNEYLVHDVTSYELLAVILASRRHGRQLGVCSLAGWLR